MHVSLNETVIAENKVSMVAARADTGLERYSPFVGWWEPGPAPSFPPPLSPLPSFPLSSPIFNIFLAHRTHECSRYHQLSCSDHQSHPSPHMPRLSFLCFGKLVLSLFFFFLVSHESSVSPSLSSSLRWTTFEKEHTVDGVFVKGRQMDLNGCQAWLSVGCCVCTHQYASGLAECTMAAPSEPLSLEKGTERR